MKYDREAVMRFVNDATNRRQPAPDDQRAAATALIDYFAGVDVRAKMGLTRKEGQRGKEFDPRKVICADDDKYVTIPGGITGLKRVRGTRLIIAMHQWLRDEISDRDAFKAVENALNDKRSDPDRPVSPPTVRKFMREYKALATSPEKKRS